MIKYLWLWQSEDKNIFYSILLHDLTNEEEEFTTIIITTKKSGKINIGSAQPKQSQANESFWFIFAGFNSCCIKGQPYEFYSVSSSFITNVQCLVQQDHMYISLHTLLGDDSYKSEFL